MSTTKSYTGFVIAAVLSVTGIVAAGPIPRQTEARQQGGAVLFFVAHKGILTNIEYNPIIFDEVLVNQGSAYNNVTGVFTVPVAGVYQFVFAAQLCRGHHNNRWYFMVNGNRSMLCHAQVTGGDTTLNTCYFMGKLRRGEQVLVLQEAGSCAWASSTSRSISFSGVLLASEGVSTLPRGMSGSGGSCPLPRPSSNVRAMTSSSAAQSAVVSSVAIALLLSLFLLV